MFNIKTILSISFILLISACSKQATIKSEQANNIDWSKLTSYSWSSVSGISNPEHKPLDANLIDQTIRQAIETQLKAKGLSLVSSGTADVEIAYHATAETVIDIDNTPSWFNEDLIRQSGTQIMDEPYRFSVGGGRIKEYDEGRIIILALKPNTEVVLWRSSVTAVVNYDASEKKRKKRINNFIKRMFNSFPK